jgi:Neocarzinostatin family/Carboxypeptidase regulatory-like domain
VRRSIVLFAVSVLVVVGADPVAGQTTRTVVVAPSTDLVNAQSVTVTGTGFAPNASVALCQGRRSPNSTFDDHCANESHGVNTDGNGAFSRDIVVFRFLEFSDGSPVIDCAQPGAECFIAVAEETDLSNVTVAQIHFRVQTAPPDMAIEGTVTDGQGNPVAGADVWAFAPGDTWVGSIRATTNAEGSYRMEDPQPSVDYHLAFDPPPGLAHGWFAATGVLRPSRSFAFPVRVTLNEPVFDAPVELPPAGVLIGTVLDSSGNPVEGAVVLGFLPTDRFFGTYAGITGADGTFRIDWLYSVTNVKVVTLAPSGSGLQTEWYDDASSRSVAEVVTVPGGTDTDLGTINLEPVPTFAPGAR